MSTASPPPPHVLRAFGLDGAVSEPLPGGEGTSFLCGSTVLKPSSDAVLAAWCQELAARSASDGCSLPTPFRTRDGGWVADGWTATAFVDGLTSLLDDPHRVIAAAGAVADALGRAGLDDVGPVRRRRDRWARADRFAWDEDDVALHGAAADIADRLRCRTSVDHDDSTLIHGDLSGNLCTDPAGDIVVLDLTPYVRPVRYAAAIVVADHLLWHDADPSLVTEIDGDEDGLARALIFRLTSEQLATDPRHGAELEPFHHVLRVLGW